MLKQKYQQELNKLSKQIIKKYRPEKIILFGSLANGKITRDSDIDLLVVKKTKKDYWQRMKELNRITNTNLPSDILAITPKELKYRLSIGDFFVKDIINNGKIVYEKR